MDVNSLKPSIHINCVQKVHEFERVLSVCIFCVLLDIRQQLGEQLKCLDLRLDNHLAMLWELQDFYKRRAELEMEYSKSLDRLVKQIMLRHKAEKHKYGSHLPDI